MADGPGAWVGAAAAQWAGPELDALRGDAVDPDRPRRRGAVPMGDAQAGDDPPYDLQSPEPRAVDLLELWKRLGREPEAELLATLGPSRAVLLSHGLTAFHKMGRRPRAIWGMGYQAAIVDVDARTVDLSPTSEHLTLGSIRQDVRIGVALDGRIGLLPAATAEALAAAGIPGVGLNGASIEAAVDEHLAFTVRYEFGVLKVQAGPIAPGGARWNLYRQDEPLDDFQPLIQTVLVPRSARSLTIEAQAWAREAGLLGPGREWTFTPRSYRIALARGG